MYSLLGLFWILLAFHWKKITLTQSMAATLKESFQPIALRALRAKAVSTKKHPHLHPRPAESHSRHTVSHTVSVDKSQFRMETQSRNFSSQYSKSRPFCNKSRQSASEIRFTILNSRCTGNQCLHNTSV